MRQVLAVAILAVASCGSVEAQTKCDKERCIYDFSVDSESGFPGWTEIVVPKGAKVVGGAGKILMQSGGPEVYESNHGHMLWSEAGDHFDWVRTTYGFTGDAGHAGWYPKLTNGDVSCDRNGHAPRASDELISLTLGDDGVSYVGGVLGGDLEALGFTMPPNLEIPPQGFAVVGVVQLVAGESAPRLLAWTRGPAIFMGNVNKHLTVSLYQENGEWIVKAKGDELANGLQWEAHAAIEGEPNFAAGVGLDAIVLPQTPCLGDVWRAFQIREIEARYQ